MGTNVMGTINLYNLNTYIHFNKWFQKSMQHYYILSKLFYPIMVTLPVIRRNNDFGTTIIVLGSILRESTFPFYLKKKFIKNFTGSKFKKIISVIDQWNIRPRSQGFFFSILMGFLFSPSILKKGKRSPPNEVEKPWNAHLVPRAARNETDNKKNFHLQ